MPLLSRLFTRERIPELMDDPSIDPAAHRRALTALARINRVTNSAGVLWPAIRNLAKRLGRTVRVLDVATGSGDVPAELVARAASAQVPIEVAACDLSPTAIAEAARRTDAVRFFVHDTLNHALPPGFDVVTSSLFLHHLSADEGIALLSNMQSATGHLVLVNDLARSRFNFLSVWFACRVLTRSPIVRFDGPASVRSAHTAAEAKSLAEQAGLHGARVTSRFPARFLLTWERA